MERQVEALFRRHQTVEPGVGVQRPGVGVRRVDHGDDLVQGLRILVRPAAQQHPVVGLLGVPQDRRPQGGVEIDGIRRGISGHGSLRSGEPWHHRGRRQGTVHRFRLVGVSVVGCHQQVRFSAAGLIGQPGTGLRIGDEASSPVDGEHCHHVEETHPQPSHEHLLAGIGEGVDAADVLVSGVSGAHPRQTGVGRHGGVGEGLHRIVGGVGPAQGEHGGVGEDLLAGGQDDPVSSILAADLRGRGGVEGHGDPSAVLAGDGTGGQLEHHRQHPA